MKPLQGMNRPESIAVGGRDFVETIKAKLGVRAKGRKISGMKDKSSLGEPQVAYRHNFNT